MYFSLNKNFKKCFVFYPFTRHKIQLRQIVLVKDIVLKSIFIYSS